MLTNGKRIRKLGYNNDPGEILNLKFSYVLIIKNAV
jgi:hypothetical protein